MILKKCIDFGTSRVVQWLRIHLEMQGMLVQSLFRGPRIPHAVGKLSPCTWLQRKIPHKKIPCATTKIWGSQINKYLKIYGIHTTKHLLNIYYIDQSHFRKCQFSIVTSSREKSLQSWVDLSVILGSILDRKFKELISVLKAEEWVEVNQWIVMRIPGRTNTGQGELREIWGTETRSNQCHQMVSG